jgi:hypothetical protein
MNQVHREEIERKAQEIDPNPDPGYDKLEKTTRKLQEEEQEHPVWKQGHTDTVDVPEDERLRHPVGTESEYY